MSYTILDLLEKLAVIEENACTIYKNIAALDGSKPIQFKSAARVLAKEEERHAEKYRKLVVKAAKYDSIDIDFGIYDKASALVRSFKSRLVRPEVNEVQELLRFALNFEKENIALLLDIQGRLVKEESDTDRMSYRILSELIEEEKKHVKNLENFVKS